MRDDEPSEAQARRPRRRRLELESQRILLPSTPHGPCYHAHTDTPYPHRLAHRYPRSKSLRTLANSFHFGSKRSAIPSPRDRSSLDVTAITTRSRTTRAADACTAPSRVASPPVISIPLGRKKVRVSPFSPQNQLIYPCQDGHLPLLYPHAPTARSRSRRARRTSWTTRTSQNSLRAARSLTRPSLRTSSAARVPSSPASIMTPSAPPLSPTSMA